MSGIFYSVSTSRELKILKLSWRKCLTTSLQVGFFDTFTPFFLKQLGSIKIRLHDYYTLPLVVFSYSENVTATVVK